MKRTTSSKNNTMQSGSLQSNQLKLHQLSSGYYILLRGVSPFLMDQVQAKIKEPPVPIVILDDGSEYPNPNDPTYLNEVDKSNNERGTKAFQAIIYFGMQLCDEEGNPVDPPDNGWEDGLRMLDVDWKSEAEELFGELDTERRVNKAKEMAFLRYIALTIPDIQIINQMVGMNEQEMVQLAQDTFQRSEE